MKDIEVCSFPNECINGCNIVSDVDIKLFPFCSKIIYCDECNQLGIEFTCDFRIRINGVVSSDLKSFTKLMDTLVLFAKRYGYKKLFYADKLSEEMMERFHDYGFVETQVLGDDWNHYMNYVLEQEVKT